MAKKPTPKAKAKGKPKTPRRPTMPGSPQMPGGLPPAFMGPGMPMKKRGMK